MWQAHSVALPRLTRLVVLAVLLFFSPRSASAAHYTFTKIADTEGSFSSFSRLPSINDEGTVTFGASLDTGGSGIFIGDGTTITSIADSSGPFSDFSGSPSINNEGTVVFRVPLDTGGQGIFTSDGTTITTIIDSSGPFSGFTPHPSINNKEVVAFSAVLDSGERGVFISDGTTIITIADSSNPFPGFSGPFENFFEPSINDAGIVAFAAGSDTLGVGGIFASDGTTAFTMADTSGPLSSFFSPSINEAGIAAFKGFLDTGVEGVFTSDGTTLTIVADTNNSFSSFLALSTFVSINNKGTVAFTAGPNRGTAGIFVGPDPVADKVLSIGDPLFDSIVTDLGFFRDGLNDKGQIAFFAVLADGTVGIYRADPVPSVTEVTIDIKPGEFPNSINPKSKGVIPVAVLTTATFDATIVNPTTVLFGATSTEAAPVHSALQDVDGDGDTDLLLHFRSQATGIRCGDTSASLTGKTFSKQAIEGADSIKTVGCK